MTSDGIINNANQLTLRAALHVAEREQRPSSLPFQKAFCLLPFPFAFASGFFHRSGQKEEKSQLPKPQLFYSFDIVEFPSIHLIIASTFV